MKIQPPEYNMKGNYKYNLIHNYTKVIITDLEKEINMGWALPIQILFLKHQEYKGGSNMSIWKLLDRQGRK